MAKKTILVDPYNDYHPIDESYGLSTEEYNLTVPEYLQLSPEDERDLDEMLIESGLLMEVTIN